MSSERAGLRPEDLLEHLEWMQRLARALTHGDAAEADDLTSDAVQVVLDKPPLLDGPVRPWLAGVLRNLARLRARSSARRRRRDAAGGAADGAAPTPAELVERVETQRLVAGLVIGLAEPFRSTLLLRYYEGMSAAEVARRLGTPPGTVRWRLKQALDQLRSALDSAHGGKRDRWNALLLPMSTSTSTSVSKSTSDVHPLERARGQMIPARVKGAVFVSAKTKGLALAIITLMLAAGAAGIRMFVGRTLPTSMAERPRSNTRAPLGAVMRLGPSGAFLVAVEAPDPDGALRIEGQVIDEQENPVSAAVVAIDSNPPRTAVTRPDGGFVFEKLMPRLYRLEAHAGELFAGPVETRVSRGSEPIVLRARVGRKVRVEVRSGSDGSAVAGALVTLRSGIVWEDRTDAQGAVVFKGVGPGWLQLRAEAVGFAPSHRALTGQRGREETVEVRLSRGAPVGGRVVTTSGAPLAGALVWAALTSEPFPALDPRLDAVTTDRNGKWHMTALGAGTYRFEASHPDHAQSGTAPTTIDGKTSRDDLDIKLEEGGAISGDVRSAEGRPLATAQVRAAVKGGVAWRLMRETFTDGDGRFRLRGLPRRAVDIVAMHDEGSSPTLALDLGTGATEQHVTLTISVSGTIQGIVVDGAARPVSEAQVVAEPERRVDVTAMRDWDLRGIPSFISDADGRFRFGGLPRGEYRIRAALPGAAPDVVWLHSGVVATTGDRDIKIVVRANGSLAGSVAYEEGGSPARLSVEVGSVTEAFSSFAGKFAMDVPAGRHDVIISGETFTTTRVQDVEIQEGAVKDVGVVKVKRGRSVSGRVLRADGTPVAGADVAAGRLLTGDGRKLNIRSEGHGVQETRSGDDGRFTMTGFDESPVVVVAERDGIGRSTSIALPRGAASADVDLVLEPTGGLDGTVKLGGKPLAGIVIIASPRGGTSSNFFVISGPDGRFDFDTLAAGPYRVSALIGEGGPRPKDMHSNSTSVEVGRRGHVDIDIPDGPVTLTIDVKTEEGGVVPAANIVVLSGMVEAASTDALVEAFKSAPDGPAALYVRDWRLPSPAPLRIGSITPGTFTICAVPLPADPTKPVEIERVMNGGGQLPVMCKVSVLAASTEVALAVPSTWLQAPK
jgi:RNA polymerase sigma factor (sigma-70 family)